MEGDEGAETVTEFGKKGLSESHFSPADYALFSLMLVASLGIGVVSAVRSRGKESTNEYLLGGRSMSPIPVTLSLVGGVVSAISVLGRPTEVYFFGTQLCVMMLGLFPGMALIHQTVLPVFYQLKLVSLTQYIELRYGSAALRKLATMCLLLTKFFYMGIYLYAPSLALSTVTSLSTWASMILMGGICTIYITVGGVKAVVYTDVLQTILMFGGVLLVVVICCVDLGGPSKVWSISDLGGRIQFFNMDTSPYTRHTFWSTLVLGFYYMINMVGFHQASYQRFASLGSLQVSKRVCYFFLLGIYMLWSVFFFSGLVAYAAYSDCDPLTSGRIKKPDQIVPFLVMDKLERFPGLPGLFVAGVYGGVLSSLSSCGNAIACLIWEDFLKERPFFASLSQARATLVLKLISAIAGLSAIFLGFGAGQLGNVFHVTYSISGSIMGPMQGIFLAGLFTPWVNCKGATVGFITALTYNIVVVVGKFLKDGGKPPSLPLSDLGCPENNILANLTLETSTTTYDWPLLHHNVTTDVAEDLTTQPMQSNTIYDVSYCYFGITGILITILVSSIVSLFTGPLSPKAVDPMVVSTSGARLHKWLWKILKRLPHNSDQDYKVDQPLGRVNYDSSFVQKQPWQEETKEKVFGGDGYLLET
ncbi:hypothetical protein Pcinc_026669 [Petrolisthes cinctipes]|uniref:Sodium-coupled monocarboxylate transporter 1 n=1 Tax=Petrolisthes cinctipes TaxID=88211 RepID=A0AAE1KBC0_PETCI|nr:hypothetical protein Pcinc_026669 [Petrolisthes cinctipes]